MPIGRPIVLSTRIWLLKTIWTDGSTMQDHVVGQTNMPALFRIWLTDLDSCFRGDSMILTYNASKTDLYCTGRESPLTPFYLECYRITIVIL